MIPSKCSKSETFDGRRSGGLAILWRKSLLKWNVKFETVALHDYFIIVQMSSSSWSAAYFVNVYMPSDDRSVDIMVDYVHILGGLQASLEDVSTENIVCLGDFNADPIRGRFWDPLMTFCTDAGLVVADAVLPPGTFTYLIVLLTIPQAGWTIFYVLAISTFLLLMFYIMFLFLIIFRWFLILGLIL